MKTCKLCAMEMDDGHFKYCEKCRQTWDKPRDRFYYIKKRQTDSYREEASRRASAWNKSHYNQYRGTQREHRETIRYQTLLFYSNGPTPQCVCCGETELDVLSLDHIGNDGKLDRANRGSVLLRAFKLKDKSKYQTMCYNCNWKKHLANLKSKWKFGKENIRQRRIKKMQHEACISHYSMGLFRCAECHMSDRKVLCLDHINNDGGVHRKRLNNGVNRGGHSVYKWIIKNNFPPMFQVLCLNCNIKKFRAPSSGTAQVVQVSPESGRVEPFPVSVS